MRSMVITLIVTVVFFGIVSGGEKPSVHLTGNPGVDFFSEHRTPHTAATLPPLVPVEESAGGGGEKSPVLAGVLSLAFPGAGELYSKNYVKAAVFAAVEVTSWVVAYTYNRKGDQQTDDFQAYANQHWRASKYVNWTLNNLSVLNPPEAGHQVDWGNRIYENGYDPQDPPVSDPPYRDMSWPEINALEDGIRGQPNNGYSHLLPAYGDQQFYELIGKYDQFSRGWDDAADDILGPADLPLRSNSKRFYEYAKMRAQANDNYDIAGTFVSVAVINHIVSAIDAFWSASRYNSNLHAEVRMRIQPTMYGIAPVTEAKIRYNF
jgi:hypothetical protein